MREQIKHLKQLNDHLLGLIYSKRLAIQNGKANRAYNSNHVTPTASNNSNELSNEFALLQLSARKFHEQQHFEAINSQKHHSQRILKSSSMRSNVSSSFEPNENRIFKKVRFK